MSPKRILIFSLAYYPEVGGAEVAVKEITDRLPDIEWDMVTMRFSKSHAVHEKVGNVSVYRIDSSKAIFPLEAFFFARKLHAERKYDAVWAIMAARAGGAALFFKMAYPEVKYILNLQEGDPVWYMKLRSLYYVNPFFRKIFINADKVQAISHYLADYAHTMGYRGKVEVIPNGVDVEKFKTQNSKLKSADETILITTSRLVKKNGVGDVIEAMKLLPENMKFKILGSGPLEKSLMLKVKRLRLEARVQFLGSIPNADLSKYLSEADIFIRPSLSEGQGISFIEAMASGLPVIATPVGGIPDFLQDGKTGYFCEPKDPESIANTIQRVINDPNKGQVISNARAMVEEKYNWDLISQDMKERVFDNN